MGFQLFAVVALFLSSVYADGDDAPKVKLWKPSGKVAHDPWKKFCGKTLCYDVLEVAEDASESDIKKSFRKLAREWHPDKNPEKGAREKFQKIAKAYETLSTEGERAKYDHLMANPAEYRKVYGEYYFKVVAPPSDVTAVVILLLIIASVIHYAILIQQKNEYNAKLVKLCMENKGPTAGGTVEILEIHQIALERYSEKSGKAVKSKALKTDLEFEQVVMSVLNEQDRLMKDPDFFSLAGFKILMSPIWIVKTLSFQLSWFIRHTIQGQEYSNDEKVYLLERSIDNWDSLSDKQKENLIEREAWKPEKLAHMNHKKSK
jgi:hypothetical protein